jgi:hypothetical protein
MQPFVTELNEYFAPLHEIADRYPTIDYDALLDMLIYHLEQGVQVSWAQPALHRCETAVGKYSSTA